MEGEYTTAESIKYYEVWCGVAQLVARRLAVRQARVRFSARHRREVFPPEQTSDEEMEKGLSEWRWIITIYAPVIYTRPCIMFWRGGYTLRCWKVLGPGIPEFFGPCEMASSR